MPLLAALAVHALAFSSAEVVTEVADSRCLVLLHKRMRLEASEDEGLMPAFFGYYLGRLAATHDPKAIAALYRSAKAAVAGLDKQAMEAEQLRCMEAMTVLAEPLEMDPGD